MATQSMLMSRLSGDRLPEFKREPLLHRLRPALFSHVIQLPSSSRRSLPSTSSSPHIQTLALFKAKPKTPPKKVDFISLAVFEIADGALETITDLQIQPSRDLILQKMVFGWTVREPKPKVEDGIFGTSGGIGFTKANELFVGRVAMIGFAASLLGEAITGKGILAQLNLETGIPIYEAEPLLLFFILFTLLGAIGALGDRGKFVDDPSPPTGLERAVIPPGKGIRAALGLNSDGPLFGFTKANELFVGRLAQLGIAFSLIGEVITGKGALAQLNIETGVPIGDIEPLLLLNVAFFFFAALNPGTGKFVTDEDEDE